jgi:hypothetical protein
MRRVSHHRTVPFAPVEGGAGSGAGQSEERQWEDQMNQERNFSQWFKEATAHEPYPYQTRFACALGMSFTPLDGGTGRKGELPRDSEKELRDGR